MTRSPCGKRSGYLARHRTAHRRIDFQKDPIDAGIRSARDSASAVQFFGGFVAERAAVGGDGDHIGVVKPDRTSGSGPESADHPGDSSVSPSALGKLDGRVPGARQIIGNETQHDAIILALSRRGDSAGVTAISSFSVRLITVSVVSLVRCALR